MTPIGHLLDSYELPLGLSGLLMGPSVNQLGPSGLLLGSSALLMCPIGHLLVFYWFLVDTYCVLEES